MTSLSYIKLDNDSSVHSFSCGNEDHHIKLNNFLKEKALNHHNEFIGTTLLATKDKNTVGYITLLTDSIKVSKEKFLTKHTNHQAMISYPPIGSIWNKTIRYKGIEVKSKTAVISLCPIKIEETGEAVIHELTHAYSNSFLDDDGVNHNNKTYFLEVIAEFFTKIASRERKTPLS